MCELEEVMKKYIRVCPKKMKNDQDAVAVNFEGSTSVQTHRLAIIKDAEGREVARVVQMSEGDEKPKAFDETDYTKCWVETDLDVEFPKDQ